MKDTIKITTLDGEVKELKFFTDLKHLPIKRYNLIQKFTLIDAAVGSTFEDVLRHFNRLDTFIEANDMESVAIERENMLMNYNFMVSEQYTKSYVFGLFIHKINGEVVDIDEDSIEDIVDMLENSDLSVGDLEDIVNFQKKSLLRA